MKKGVLTLLIVALWLGCGYLNYGLNLGYFTHQFPEADHRGLAIAMAVGGPIALPAALSDTPLHWRLQPMTEEERWQAFHRRWPDESREEFERDYN